MHFMQTQCLLRIMHCSLKLCHVTEQSRHRSQLIALKICAPLRLNALALLVEVGEQAVVGLVEQHARDGLQAREDVPRARGVLAALQPRAELACTQLSARYSFREAFSTPRILPA